MSELFAAQAKDVDIIITTALIPGKPAPRLITAETARSMKDGSVIVDLAAEQGGNCELTVPGEVTEVDGVTIISHGRSDAKAIENAISEAARFVQLDVNTIIREAIASGSVP